MNITVLQKILSVFFDPAIWATAIVISSIVGFVVWRSDKKAAEHNMHRTLRQLAAWRSKYRAAKRR